MAHHSGAISWPILPSGSLPKDDAGSADVVDHRCARTSSVLLVGAAGHQAADLNPYVFVFGFVPWGARDGGGDCGRALSLLGSYAWPLLSTP